MPKGADAAHVERVSHAVFLTRDLINTPTNDMGPDALEEAVHRLARSHKAKVSVVRGDALIKQNFPMIHAVGRASAEAPRLIDMVWGDKDAPRVTLVGKGVCFDTGGLDIKPSSGMLLMKKDMGGAANVLGLASMIMAAKLKLRLRVLIPAVENAISANAFRPGDVLTSRKGITVEIGNTDAEGRLILADALALADEEKPGDARRHGDADRRGRVALGPDLPPFYTQDEGLAAASGRCGSGSRRPAMAPAAVEAVRLEALIEGRRHEQCHHRRLRRLDHRGACSCSVLSRKQPRGRISTSLAGAQANARIARSAARRRASGRSNGCFRNATPPKRLLLRSRSSSLTETGPITSVSARYLDQLHVSVSLASDPGTAPVAAGQSLGGSRQEPRPDDAPGRDPADCLSRTAAAHGARACRSGSA